MGRSRLMLCVDSPGLANQRAMTIEVIHSAVPGRLRVRAVALYRRPRLLRLAHDRIAAASDLTITSLDERRATLLIRYPAARAPGEVVQVLKAVLERILAGGSAKPSRAAEIPDAVDTPRQPPDIEPAWHALPTDAVIARLGVDPELGLALPVAERRLVTYGFNAVDGTPPHSELAMLARQFATLPVAMLGVSAAITLATGGIADAAVIASVGAINAAIGFATERQAERTIRALGDHGPVIAEVIRDGERRAIPAARLVPGDLLLLSPGQRIGADARLVRARRLTVDESALTGESLPSSKRADQVLDPETPLADRVNRVYMGTAVSGGNGLAVVTTTGRRTEIGRIQALVDSADAPETTMERQLGILGTQLGILSGAVCAGVFAIGLLRGQPLLQMLNSAVSLAVAAVPEGLPAVATTTLALGIRDMRRRQVAVRKIDSVESLGALEVLCLDKTGTLTANRMSVVELYLDGATLAVDDGNVTQDALAVETAIDTEVRWMAVLTSLCSDAAFNGAASGPAIDGSPTEGALLAFARANGVDVGALRSRHRRLEARQRAEGRPLMSTLHVDDGRFLLAVKGSPVEVLARCDAIHAAHGIATLDDVARADLAAANERMAGRALRVLAVAYRRPERRNDAEAEHLVWVGLIGMRDPLRPGMQQLVRIFHQAGIRTVMITGDQSATAHAIGKELGLGRDERLEVLDAVRLDRIDPELLTALVTKVDVFARVSPAHKLRIVQALQRAGRVVAMTGDGINDGPALKAAEVGVAMGAGGSDVARSVADVVIEDDNLHTMADAVRQGRAIYDNIRKTVHYLLSTNFSEIEVMLTALTLGLGQPLKPMQLLWINLVTDIFPGLALALEPAGGELMQRQPRPRDEPIVTRRRLGRMALESGSITAGALAAYSYGLRTGGAARASTLGFHSLTTAQLLHAYYCRSEVHGLFNASGRQRNPWLDAALGGTLAVHALTVLLPSLRGLLGNTALRAADLPVILAAAVLPMLVNEAGKLWRPPAKSPDCKEPRP